MAKKWKPIADAWDDDWETQADKAAAVPAAPEPAPALLSKKERIAQHAELNRRIWQAAEEPDNGVPLQYLSQQPAPPLSQTFKAPMTVLARKPVLAKRDPITGAMAKMGLQDDSDEEDKKPQETPEEIRARQQREREEKQRRYDEVRAKIFGESGAGSSNSKGGSGRSSGATTPGTTTPPRAGGERRGRGRGRGGYRGNDRNGRHDRGESGDHQRPKENVPSGGASLRDESREKELYDPNFSPRSGVSLERRPGAVTPIRSTPRNDDQVIRAPRGPDGTGRGGFGFARGGSREG